MLILLENLKSLLVFFCSSYCKCFTSYHKFYVFIYHSFVYSVYVELQAFLFCLQCVCGFSGFPFLSTLCMWIFTFSYVVLPSGFLFCLPCVCGSSSFPILSYLQGSYFLYIVYMDLKSFIFWTQLWIQMSLKCTSVLMFLNLFVHVYASSLSRPSKLA